MERLTFSNLDISYAVREELKTLRTNIQFCGDDKRVILVTSCLSGEGKSTTTQQLAQSLSEIDKRVLYVDADLRKDKDDKHGLNGQADYGLTHFLSGQCASRDAIYSTNVRGLYAVPSGKVPPNPSELLNNERMHQFIAEMKEVFDYVIVDSAPLGMVVDAAVLAPICDGAVLLIESGTVSYRLAQDVAKQLQNTQCPILGVVLNKVDRSKTGYYGKYGKYGAYGAYGAYGSSGD